MGSCSSVVASSTSTDTGKATSTQQVRQQQHDPNAVTEMVDTDVDGMSGDRTDEDPSPARKAKKAVSLDDDSPPSTPGLGPMRPPTVPDANSPSTHTRQSPAKGLKIEEEKTEAAATTPSRIIAGSSLKPSKQNGVDASSPSIAGRRSNTTKGASDVDATGILPSASPHPDASGDGDVPSPEVESLRAHILAMTDDVDADHERYTARKEALAQQAAMNEEKARRRREKEQQREKEREERRRRREERERDRELAAREMELNQRKFREQQLKQQETNMHHQKSARRSSTTASNSSSNERHRSPGQKQSLEVPTDGGSTSGRSARRRSHTNGSSNSSRHHNKRAAVAQLEADADDTIEPSLETGEGAKTAQFGAGARDPDPPPPTQPAVILQLPAWQQGFDPDKFRRANATNTQPQKATVPPLTANPPVGNVSHHQSSSTSLNLHTANKHSGQVQHAMNGTDDVSNHAAHDRLPSNHFTSHHVAASASTPLPSAPPKALTQEDEALLDDLLAQF